MIIEKQNRDKILYLDDEQDNLDIFSFCFTEEYHVFAANSRLEALETLKSEEIKVLITDQRMPDITGIEFIKEVHAYYPEILCVILTAFPDDELLMEAINEANVFRFILKPWKELDVRHTLQSAIDAYNTKAEKQKLIHDLQLAQVKAVESDRLKSAFLANISHEIRTPLNGIIGFSALLNNAGESENIEHYIESIQSSSDALTRVVEDMVSASQLQLGSVFHATVEFNFYEFFIGLKSNFQSIADRKGIKLSFSIPGIDPEATLYSDRTKLNEIFVQMLRNALKFTESGSIEFGITKEDYEVFFVKDTGIGIEESKQQIIFQQFRQEDEDMTRSFGGNGLGLSIAHSLVSIFGGDIWLDSKKGQGSTFYFRFPYTWL